MADFSSVWVAWAKLSRGLTGLLLEACCNVGKAVACAANENSFCRALLCRANFCGALLCRANFCGALLCGVIFSATLEVMGFLWGGMYLLFKFVEAVFIAV